MGFELSCGDSTFPKLSHQMALSVIADLGIEAVDLCVFAGYPHFTPGHVVADPELAAATAVESVQRAGLRVADVFVILRTSFDELAVNHPNPEQRTESRLQFTAILEFARRVDSPGVTVLPGIPWEGESNVDARSRAARELQWRAELAAQAGLALSIEPHYQSIVETPQATLELLERAPDVTVTLDPAHFVYQGIPDQELDVLIPRTRHIQARQAAAGIMQAPVNEGTIDFVRLVRALEASGYDGYFSLEYQWDAWLDCNKVDCISETALLRDVFLRARREA